MTMQANIVRLTLCLALASATHAATVVTVYRDYNNNGTQDAGEPGVPNATANAFVAAGTFITGTTGDDGTVSLATTNSTAYRVEVTSPSGLQMGGAAANAQRSNVQFGTDPAGATNLALSFAASNAAQYCASATDADMLAVKNVREQLAGTTAQPSLSSWNYLDDSTGALGAQTNWALDQSSVGPTVIGTGAQWGLAYRRRGDVAFSAAFVRGASPLGGSSAEESTGNIYLSTRDSAGVISTSLYLDLNAAAYGTIDLGANPHPRAIVTNYDTLPLPAREETGKVGLGDIDLSEDESRLFAVNLNQKELLVIPVGTALVPSVPASDAQIQRIAIPKPSSCANDDDFRPFAIGINDASVYIGAVCTAQNVAPISNQLDVTRRAAMRGYILALNVAGTAISATPVLEFPLNYNRQFSNDGAGFIDSGNWLPWIDAPAYPGGNYGSAVFYANPQPILSDLAFDNFGFLTIAFSDRLNFQVFDAEARYAGDMLLACENGSGGFNLESNGSCTARGVTRTSLDPTANGTAPDDNLNSGPGGREFYFGERYNYTLSTPATDSAMNGPDYHRESASGALAILGGQGGVVTTTYDVGDTFNNGTRVMNQGNLPVTNTGLMYRIGGYMPAPDSPTSDTQYHEFRLVEGNTSFGKGNGLGDIEVLCEAAQPVEIGNLVFTDTDADGVQDAGETGIAGITVELHNAAGTLIGRTTTDANGNYAFSVREIDTGTDPVTTDADVQLTFALLYGQNVFVSIPGTTTTGLGAGGAGNIANTLRATLVNSNTGALSDNRDSEGVVLVPGAGAARVGTAITLPASAGASNYSIDFGFRTTAALNSIGNRIWYDTDNDGILDAGEQPIAGVLVELRNSTNSAGIDDPHTVAVDTYSVTTDATGYYRFDDLPNASYIIRIAASNFTAGVLSGYVNSSGATAATESRDNGTDASSLTAATTGVLSAAVALSAGTNIATETDLSASTFGTNGPSGTTGDDLRVDFGFYRITISGTVHIDDGLSGGTSNDGVRNGGEIFVATGTVVRLLDNSGNVLASTTTDASGNYSFDRITAAATGTFAGQAGAGLPATTNFVVEVQPPNDLSSATPTQAVNGGSDNNDKGAPFSTTAIRSAAFTIAPGTTTDGKIVTNASASTAQPIVDFALIALDYGDLPDTGAGVAAGNYQTLASDSGASNLVVTTLRLGASVGAGYDSNTDGPQSVAADGDDGVADDENGVSVNNVIRDGAGNAPSLTLNVTNTSGASANLCAYADLNNDGSFSATETFTSTVANGTTGANVVATFTGTIASAQAFANNRLYVRARLQTAACSASGFGGNGEVEDIAIPVVSASTAISAIGQFCPGQSVTFTITYSNVAGFQTATAFPITSDLVGADDVALVGVPQFAAVNWAVTSLTGGASAAISTGTGDINTSVSIPGGGSVVITVQGTIANASTTTRTVSANVAGVAGTVDSTLANDSNTGTSTLNPSCTGTPNGAGALCPNLASAPAALDCSGAADTVVNAYHAGVAATQGSRCLRVNPTALTGSVGSIAAGDVLLVIQMQDADINTTNTSSYGDGTAGAPGGALAAPAPTAGRYEYVIAQTGIQTTGVATGSCSGQSNVIEVSGGNLAGPTPGSSGLINGYSATAPDTFQVVRVRLAGNVTFSAAGCSFGAPAWNGTAGGIVAIDSTGTINLGGTAATTRINVAGDGFRGGACAITGTASTTSQFVSATAGTTNTKGEGLAGVASALSGGSLGLGAPANAGGSGQTCNLTNGFQGAGGGANGGVGGNGGGGTAATCNTNPGGHGGGILPGTNDTSRLWLGGGGGGGAQSAAGACDGSSGGGIVILRASAMTGQGTIIADAAAVGGSLASARAGGGGGAGGNVIVQTGIAGGTTFNNITMNASGADAVSNTGVNAGGSGGGGGGRIFISQTAATPLGTRSIVGGIGGNTAATDGTAGSAGTITTGIDPVNTSPGVKPAFICFQSQTVPVTLSHVDVREIGGDLQVNFSTATEAGTLGFKVLADVGRDVQARVEIAALASKTVDSLKEQSYSVRAKNPGATQIWLEESSVDGKSQLYGPYPLGRAVGEVGLTQTLNWTAINAEQARFNAARNTAVRGLSPKAAELRIAQSGWVEITHEALLAAGVDFTGESSRNIAVRRGSETVPARISASRFGSGERIGFYAQAVENSLYSNTALYRIELGRNLSIAELDARSIDLNNAALLSAPDTLVLNANTAYSFSSPLEDPWYSFRALRSGGNSVGVGSLNFVLKDRVDLAIRDASKASSAVVTPETIEVSFWGGLDYAGTSPDHHAVFKLNDVVLGESKFDGFAARTQRFTVPLGVLRTGSNVFSVELPNSTGFAADIVNVESVKISYERKLIARDDQLRVRLPATPIPRTADSEPLGNVEPVGDVEPVGAEKINTSSFVISGLTGQPVQMFLARAGSLSVLQTDAINAGSVRIDLTTQAGDQLIVSPVQRNLQPTAALALEDPIAGAQASYLIISHPSFISALSPFVLAKQLQGFSVKVVDVEAIYRYYSAGVVDPAAIQLAIRRAQRSLATTHVLLVGGDSYDYLNVLGINSVSFIPTNYRRTGPIIAFAPTDVPYADSDGDGKPDLALGRWPVRTMAELNAIIAKSLNYQSSKKALFVSDRNLNGVSYASEVAPLVSLLGADWSKRQLSLDNYVSGQASNARADIVDQLNTGTTLLSYYGHSAPSSWSREGLITASQVNGGLFDSVEQSFATLQLGCWGTYFVEPTSNTVAHALLLRPKGAVLVLGATSLTESTSDLVLANGVLARIATESFGEALQHTQQQLGREQPGALDVILGGTLLGDPSLR
jgi:hypothetical protein